MDYIQIAKENNCIIGPDGDAFMCLGRDYPVGPGGFASTQEEACKLWYEDYMAWYDLGDYPTKDKPMTYEEAVRPYIIAEEILKELDNE